MKKTLIFAIIVMALAAVAGAQDARPCTLTIASGQSLSPAFVAGTRTTAAGSPCAAVVGWEAFRNIQIGVPLQLFPPAALDATSYGLLIYSCTDVAGTTCLPGQDAAGNKLLIPLLGGVAPTSFVQLDPAIMAGGRTFKFQVVTSAGVGVAQTANRTFTLMVRPL